MRRAAWFAAVSALAMGVAAPAFAADAPADSNALPTVIVTARKIEENAQAVPISITALNQSQLDKLNVKTIEDLKYVAPSVYIAPTTFRQDTLNVTIRGQRNFDSPSGGGNPGLAFDPASAIYVDGVYYARAIGLTGALFDLDTVDVLKGPQGTLVGRNSTGGAILFNTRKPTEDYGGSLKLMAGDYGQYAAQGVLNVPIGDKLAFRVAVSATGTKGYIKNYFYDPVSGYRNSTPGMGTQKLAGRFSLAWTPDATLSVTLRADLAGEHDTGTTYHDLGYFVGTAPSSGKPSICNIPATCTGFTDLLGHPIAPYYTNVTATTVSGVNTAPAAYNALLNSVAREQTYGFWSTEQAVSNTDVGHYKTVSATVDKQFGGVDLKWVSAHRWWDNHGQAISRGLPFETNTYLYQFPQYRSWQSELTATGGLFDNKLKWTTGLFYFKESSPNDGGYLFLFLPSAGSAPTAAGGKQITITDSSRNSERNTSYAGYAQGVYNLTQATRLTAGARYTVDERWAHLATQTIRTPATSTTTATLPNGVFDPSPYTFSGISYAGQSHYCALTNVNGVLLPLAQCAVDVDKTFHKPTWTLAVDHDLFGKTLVYATTRSGYRSGAINTGAINPAVTVARPEDVLDYEVGIKSDWSILGMPIRSNLALYETAYHNIQIQTALPNVTLATGPGGGACTQTAFNAGQCLGTANDNVTLNAKRARIYGAEFDITIAPVHALTLNWAGSYIDAHYTDFTFSPPAGYLLPTGTTNLSGTPIPLPQWQTNATATWDFGASPIGDVAVSAHYYWQSRYLADLRTYNAVQRTSAYGLLNLQLGVTGFLGSKADLSLFMNNAANEKACLPEYNGALNSAPNGTFGVANTSGVLQCVPLAPRQSGVSISYAF